MTKTSPEPGSFDAKESRKHDRSRDRHDSKDRSSQKESNR
jgi:hypothetical protein